MKIIRILSVVTASCALVATAIAADDTTTPPAKKGGGKKGGKSATTQTTTSGTTAKSDKKPVPLLNPGDSPTMGATAPKGAVILFDGKNMDAWVHHVPKDWLKPGEPCKWPIAEGVVTSVANSGSLITKQDFSDFKFHAEFATTETPTNAGFYLHSHYELKILETYNNPTPPSCGNFGNCDAGGTPKVNASRAKGEWQTYDIEFHAPKFDADGKKVANARATVVLNGVTLYENQELSNLRLAAANIPETPRAPLQLKEHGNVVKYRNMWILPLAETPPPAK